VDAVRPRTLSQLPARALEQSVTVCLREVEGLLVVDQARQPVDRAAQAVELLRESPERRADLHWVEQRRQDLRQALGEDTHAPGMAVPPTGQSGVFPHGR
jgi:t-SNARE complex subunit (syntaxin)